MLSRCGLLDNRVVREVEVDEVGHVALQVDLGWILHPHEVGVEDAQVSGPPFRKTQPRLQEFSSQAVQDVHVRFVDVVYGKMELQGWQDVARVDCHLELASD